ncbi:hypothetical protein K488DRAFT_88708 [Vararia minispora EC-137]|uniref:Uncharacterized protein n=1 Tax=Vararia minispora EC-137 TaxID=1314806 RepID=A0ACB8QCC8_9AGAM|nr:hypothetical protein K488DRAFT_88708 [Vararia minispora EC-137]
MATGSSAGRLIGKDGYMSVGTIDGPGHGRLGNYCIVIWTMPSEGSQALVTDPAQVTKPELDLADDTSGALASNTPNADPFTCLPDEFLAVLKQSGIASDAMFGHDFVTDGPAESQQVLLRYAHFHAAHVSARETQEDCLICVASEFNRSTVALVLSEARAELKGELRDARESTTRASAEVKASQVERDAARTRMLMAQTETADRATANRQLLDEATVLWARISALESSEAHTLLELGEDRATAIGIAALKAMIANSVSQPPTAVQWNTKVYVKHFRSLWADDKRPVGVLIYPYWPKVGTGLLNIWLDAATIRGHLLFERTVSRVHNARLFATALLVALDPSKYHAYMVNNLRGWTVGEKLDCGRAGKIKALAADPEIVMQIWMRCRITPEHATDTFKYALYFTFEAYILRCVSDLPCPTGLLELYNAVWMADIYGRGPDGVSPMVHPWPAWIPGKMTISKVVWSGNQPPPPTPAVPLWDVNQDHLAPAPTLGYIHEHTGDLVGCHATIVLTIETRIPSLMMSRNCRE